MKTLQDRFDNILSCALGEYHSNNKHSHLTPGWLDEEFTQVRAFAARHGISWKFESWIQTLKDVRENGRLGDFDLKMEAPGPSQEYFAGFDLLESFYLGTECQRVDRRTGEREPGVQYCDHGTRATYWSPMADVEALGRMVMEEKEDAYSVWCSETVTIECKEEV
jgi:hypothetical protein